MTADETPFVFEWTGREADALRMALRLTSERFAETLGISERTVCRWKANPSKGFRLDTQQLLDSLFERYEGDVRVMRRFAMLLAEPAGGERTHRDSPIVMVAEMALMQARIQELEARLAGGTEVAA